MRKVFVRSNMPKKLWSLVAISCSRIWSRTRDPLGDGRSPMELRTGRRPTYRREYVIGCRAIARRPVPLRGGKLDVPTVDGVYLGRARNKVGFWVYSEEHGLVTSTNVTFVEDEFPYKKKSSPAPSDGHEGLVSVTTETTEYDGDRVGC